MARIVTAPIGRPRPPEPRKLWGNFQLQKKYEFINILVFDFKYLVYRLEMGNEILRLNIEYRMQ